MKFWEDEFFKGKSPLCIIYVISQGLVEQGLCLSTSAAERLQEKLGEELTSEISILLAKLTSGELVPTTLPRPSVPLPVLMVSIPDLKQQVDGKVRGDITAF